MVVVVVGARSSSPVPCHTNFNNPPTAPSPHLNPTLPPPHPTPLRTSPPNITPTPLTPTPPLPHTPTGRRRGAVGSRAGGEPAGRAGWRRRVAHVSRHTGGGAGGHLREMKMRTRRRCCCMFDVCFLQSSSKACVSVCIRYRGADGWQERQGRGGAGGVGNTCACCTCVSADVLVEVLEAI